ncbi:hypothetical protein INR49_011409 [Caranx melampygus]|nr:hypothetical protein INR49_011409 [Caranx melampygus]
MFTSEADEQSNSRHRGGSTVVLVRIMCLLTCKMCSPFSVRTAISFRPSPKSGLVHRYVTDWSISGDTLLLPGLTQAVDVALRREAAETVLHEGVQLPEHPDLPSGNYSLNSCIVAIWDVNKRRHTVPDSICNI